MTGDSVGLFRQWGILVKGRKPGKYFPTQRGRCFSHRGFLKEIPFSFSARGFFVVKKSIHKIPANPLGKQLILLIQLRTEEDNHLSVSGEIIIKNLIPAKSSVKNWKRLCGAWIFQMICMKVARLKNNESRPKYVALARSIPIDEVGIRPFLCPEKKQQQSLYTQGQPPPQTTSLTPIAGLNHRRPGKENGGPISRR